MCDELANYSLHDLNGPKKIKMTHQKFIDELFLHNHKASRIIYKLDNKKQRNMAQALNELIAHYEFFHFSSINCAPDTFSSNLPIQSHPISVEQIPDPFSNDVTIQSLPISVKKIPDSFSNDLHIQIQPRSNKQIVFGKIKQLDKIKQWDFSNLSIYHGIKYHGNADNNRSKRIFNLNIGNLNEKNCSVLNTVGDGNCLYRAVSMIMFGNDTQHKNLRTQCLLAIKNNYNYFDFICENYGFVISEEISDIQTNAVYGGTIAQLALSVVTSRPIIILNHECSNPEFIINVYIAFRRYLKNEPIFICFDSHHFSAIVKTSRTRLIIESLSSIYMINDDVF